MTFSFLDIDSSSNGGQECIKAHGFVQSLTGAGVSSEVLQDVDGEYTIFCSNEQGSSDDNPSDPRGVASHA